MRFVHDVLKGRLPLVIGTGAIRTEDAVFFAAAARETGADAIPIVTPPYAVPTAREIAVHALAVDRAANLPAMLYNYPARMCVNMDVETLGRVGRSPNFCAAKERRAIPAPAHAGAGLPVHPALLRHGRPGAGALRLGRKFLDLRRVRTSRPRRIWRSTAPAWSRATSPRAAASCRRCCP